MWKKPARPKPLRLMQQKAPLRGAFFYRPKQYLHPTSNIQHPTSNIQQPDCIAIADVRQSLCQARLLQWPTGYQPCKRQYPPHSTLIVQAIQPYTTRLLCNFPSTSSTLSHQNVSRATKLRLFRWPNGFPRLRFRPLQPKTIYLKPLIWFGALSAVLLKSGGFLRSRKLISAAMQHLPVHSFSSKLIPRFKALRSGLPRLATYRQRGKATAAS